MTHVSGTTPYPWPYDGDLSPGRLALVVAGWDTRWHAAAAGAGALCGAIATLAATVSGAGGLVVTISHGGRRPTAAEPVVALALGGAVPMESAGIDGFFGSPLDATLRSNGRTHLLFAGLGLEGPVHSTMRSANDRGYECLLLLDVAAPVDEELTGAAQSSIEMSGGIFGAVGTSASLVAALG